jgi:leader peptidase (prepilin peptidase) / N-methyltransferase
MHRGSLSRRFGSCRGSPRASRPLKRQVRNADVVTDVHTAAAVMTLAPALAFASFLNVVVTRVPARRSVIRPPSSCLGCGAEILWRDNIPLVSYVLLRGRCRSCRERISLRYPAVELVGATLIVACFAVLGPTAWAALGAALCAGLVTLSAIGVERRSASRSPSCS